MRAKYKAKELKEAGVVIVIGKSGQKPNEEILVTDLSTHDRLLAESWYNKRLRGKA